MGKGLSQYQKDIIDFIANDMTPEMGSSEMCEAIGISRQHLHDSLHRLDKRGLVKITPINLGARLSIPKGK